MRGRQNAVRREIIKKVACEVVLSEAEPHQGT